MDANAVEDPGIIGTSVGGTGDGDLDDIPDPELDDVVKLKPGDAPRRSIILWPQRNVHKLCCFIDSA